ncbi:tRNA (adenosine(37)-N6)-dimethylallyltransferase MiaA [Psychroserpens burtonensis]|uniref:tRNA dimethylallyltransferase n=1 Tax=Psychroserpens burtonensis TaxID=49278 RepID=A0A5C7BDZ6_9FLAO|nr:tRNA (adenosine(37)-N6)-dimethylallyltransferase MiaA [Psychroserpens burtonensis]TXE17459.1 tRNA (adenosine(37)-N6)-dimethylallyltransferase MiaA [Psychroserpens burtonensis]
MTKKTPILISIVGPTAIGKTALSIKLAKYFNTEIISADSRQFYQEMQIGTAAPTLAELAAVPHHFIKQISVDSYYNVGAFEKDAISLLTELYIKHDIVIMVGGSGLYVNAVTKGLDEFPEVNPDIRDVLNSRFKNDGLEGLQFQLKELDPKAYNKIAIDNPQRLIRALEVCLSSGKPYSSFLTSENKKRDFETITIGITANREIIYDRINRRVDLMIEDGLLGEVEDLLPKKHQNALNTVGYKELFNVLEKQWTLAFAISEIKKNTRRFAKRQLTWFKKNEETIWFDYEVDLKTIIESINKRVNTLDHS